jgi:hypothetical protein
MKFSTLSKTLAPLGVGLCFPGANAKKCFQIVVSVLVMLFAGNLKGQIFVANASSGTVGEYTLSGTPINTSLISGLFYPTALAYDGNGHLFVASMVAQGDTRAVIGEYTTSGAVVNANLLSGPQQYFPAAMTLDGNGHLLVAFDNGAIMEYTTSGAPVYVSPWAVVQSYPGGMAYDSSGNLFVSSGYGNISEITPSFSQQTWTVASLEYPGGITVIGNDVFVVDENAGKIREYTTSGATVNTSLVSGASWGLTSYNGNLYAVSGGVIAEYTTSGGTVNASLVTGLNNATGLVVVPEPAATLLVSLAIVLVLAGRGCIRLSR